MTKRFYQGLTKVFGLIRIFDGPQEKQGFYLVTPDGQRTQLPAKIKNWKDAEKLVEACDRTANGG